MSRQLVLFCVERRKAWRMLQSKAGVENKEYKAKRAILADVNAGKISKDELFARAEDMMKERLKGGAGRGRSCDADRRTARRAARRHAVNANPQAQVSRLKSDSQEDSCPSAVPVPCGRVD